MSLGYRYVTKTIETRASVTSEELYQPTRALRGDCATGHVNPDGTCNATTSEFGDDIIPIHEQWGLFGFFFQPTNTFRLNANVEAMYADNSYTRISPRQIQHYRVRGIYKPKQWMNFSGAVNIFESRNNVTDINYLQHARDYSFGASVTPSEHWGVDLAYSYQDVFSRIDECYLYTDAVYPSPVAPCPAHFAGYALSSEQWAVQRTHAIRPDRDHAGSDQAVAHTLRIPDECGQRKRDNRQSPAGARIVAIAVSAAVRECLLPDRPSVDLEGGLELLQLRRGHSDRADTASQLPGKCLYTWCPLRFLAAQTDRVV